MPFLDKTGLAHLWDHIMAKLNTKVDIEADKGLSTNDYTNEEKEKLASLDVNTLVKTVNNIESDTNGNVALVASDVGATTEEYVNEIIATKMDRENPTGTGSLSLNRKADTEIGFKSVAEGIDATSTGRASHAEGDHTTASYNAAHAEGNYTTASAYTAHAEGNRTTASGYVSHAEGEYTTASGDHSHAEGNATIAKGRCQHAQGKFNVEDSANKYLHIVGNGSDANHRANAHTIDWNGLGWFKGGIKVGGTSQDDTNAKEVATTEYVDNKMTDIDLSGKMDKTNPTGTGSFSMNRVSGSPAGTYSFAEGYNGLAMGKASHVEGSDSTASAGYAHAEGFHTLAGGISSHAEGNYTEASTNYTHAEGTYTKAGGTGAHAEGDHSNANGIASHAEGYYTTASGYAAHAEGYYTTASGGLSHTEGEYTIAASDVQHAQGKYNIADSASKYAHIVGNGDSETSRSNAHTVDWDGNAWFSGDVYTGSTSGTDKDAGSKKLATESYVDEAIAAIPTPDLEANAIIDVAELPTANINENAFYRALRGMIVSNQNIDQTLCFIVNELPETGEPVTMDGRTVYAAYYNIQDGDVYGYFSGLPAPVAVDTPTPTDADIPVGWYTFAQLAPAFGVNWAGVIWDMADCAMDDSFALLLEGDIYHHKGDWNLISPTGWRGTGIGAEVFNHPSNIASNYYAHAEGRDTEASGSISHAEGYNTTASGAHSHAEGSGTTASGDWSHAEGRNTVASSKYQHTQGKFNIEDSSNKYAHIVGNGADDTTRSNAHTLDWNGLGWFAGGLKVGGTGQDDANAQEVATKSYVDEAIASVGSSGDSDQVDAHNISSTAHGDIRESISAVSALVGDKAVSKQIADALKNVSVEGGVYVPSDWDAKEDETGHILNRTHYKETHEGRVVVYPEATHTLTPNNGTTATETTGSLGLKVGETYYVNWNGTEYTCVAQDYSAVQANAVGAGNPVAFGYPSTGEPFYLYQVPGYIGVGSVEGLTSVTLSISQDGIVETFHQLDPRYIPEMYYTEEGAGKVEIPISVNWFDDNEDGVMDGTYILNELLLVEGQTYIVDWNGTEYSCVATFMGDIEDGSGVALGDVYTISGGQVGSAPTGEPFAIITATAADMNAAGIWGMAMAFTPGEVPFSIYSTGGSLVHQMDPKYIPEMYYTEARNKVILEETTVAMDDTLGIVLGSISFIPDNNYIVTWNGVNYHCVAKNGSVVLVEGVCLGDVDHYGDNSTGEPFVICAVATELGSGIVFYAYDGSSEVTLSIIEGNKVHKIPEKYLPNTVVTIDDANDMVSELNVSIEDTRVKLQKNLDETKEELEEVINDRLELAGHKKNLTRSYNDICYADGVYIAVGGSVYARSEDGVKWTETSFDSFPWVRAICYGNNKLVAVGSSGGIMTRNEVAVSDDLGLTWTQYKINNLQLNWRSVCYGNGKFIAIGGDPSNTSQESFACSEDGAVWTVVPAPGSGVIWNAVCYGGGRFVAVGSKGSIAYSDDGIAWTMINSFSTLYLSSICYGNGKFTILNGTAPWYSEDGIAWNRGTCESNTGISNIYSSGKICYANNMFVAASGDSNRYASFAYSLDGVHWVVRYYDYRSAPLVASCYGDGKFVAIGDIVAYSYDGILWDVDALYQHGDKTHIVRNALLKLSGRVNVGDQLIVKEVDDMGYPTKWEGVPYSGQIETLPTITAADEGKVLMVVGGKLQLVSLNLAIDENGVISVQ